MARCRPIPIPASSSSSSPSGNICFATGSFRRAAGELKLGRANFQTSFFSNQLNTPAYQIAAHGYANAFISYATADERWTFTLTGRNLTNSFFFTSLTPVGAAIKAGPYAGTLLLRAQNPRTVFLKAACAF
jgi:iron complex outermembrane receptor protein